jgi:hypothetical protein
MVRVTKQLEKETDAEKPRGKRTRKEKEREKKTDDHDNTLGPKRRGGARKTALRRQKARKSADKGGGRRTPAMRNGNGESRNKFSGRDKTRKTMDSEDRVGEARSPAASIEISSINPGTKDLARKMQGIDLNDGRHARSGTGFVKPSETSVRREHILPELMHLGSVVYSGRPFGGDGQNDMW